MAFALAANVRVAGMMKTKREVYAKLNEVLSWDARVQPENMPDSTVFGKVAAAKTLLWVLGQNDDDRWHITAAPGPAIDVRVKM
jgi:hypothetical protein